MRDFPARISRAAGLVNRKTLVIAAVLAIVGAGLAAVFWPRPPQDRLRDLIDRLATARPHDRKIMGDLVVGATAGDESVFDRIRASGPAAVPYLIEGLHHKDGQVRVECARLLEHSPTKAGIQALVSCLSGDRLPVPPFYISHLVLSDLTGRCEFLPSGMESAAEKQKIRQYWESWWAENKDRIVDGPQGIAILKDDGTTVRLPIPRKTPDGSP
jgi:hypothetical protein